jgi:hypothetical protein
MVRFKRILVTDEKLDGGAFYDSVANLSVYDARSRWNPGYAQSIRDHPSHTPWKLPRREMAQHRSHFQQEPPRPIFPEDALEG